MHACAHTRSRESAKRGRSWGASSLWRSGSEGGPLDDTVGLVDSEERHRQTAENPDQLLVLVELFGRGVEKVERPTLERSHPILSLPSGLH